LSLSSILGGLNADHASKTIVHGYLKNGMIYSAGDRSKFSLKGSIFIVQNESDL